MQAHRILLGFLEVNHLANYPRTYQGWSIFPFNKQPVGFDGFFYGNSEVLRSKGPTLYVVCSPFLPLAPSLWTCRWCFSEGIWRMGKPWGWFMEGSRRLGKFHEFLPRNRGLWKFPRSLRSPIPGWSGSDWKTQFLECRVFLLDETWMIKVSKWYRCPLKLNWWDISVCHIITCLMLFYGWLNWVIGFYEEKLYLWSNHQCQKYDAELGRSLIVIGIQAAAWMTVMFPMKWRSKGLQQGGGVQHQPVI